MQVAAHEWLEPVIVSRTRARARRLTVLTHDQIENDQPAMKHCVALVSFFILITAIRPVAGQDLPGGRAVDVDLQRAQFNALMIKTVREFNTAWQNAWPVVSNGNRLADHYNSEATLLQPGGGLISGQSAIRTFTDSLRTQVRDATLALM